MIMEIVKYPDPLLRKVSEPIEVIDNNIRKLAQNMIDTMYNSNGVGLAGPQVGVLKRIVIIDSSPSEEPDPKIYINPVIEKKSGSQIGDEGCLSVPEIYARVKRADKVSVYAQDLEGNELEIEAEGLEARAFQHEIDHLDGILFIDKVGLLEKQGIKTDLAELEYEYEQKNK
jgi:peptide deformylase